MLMPFAVGGTEPSKVVVDVQVIIVDRRRFARGRGFQQGAGGVAFIIFAHLVDFVENYYRIACSGLCYGIENTAGRAPIGFAMTADFASS